MDQRKIITIIVVGEPGMGKSSFINMLIQQNEIMADQGNDLKGITKNIKKYQCRLTKNNVNVVIYDCPGFGDWDVDTKLFFKNWNNEMVNQKVDLVFFCQLYTNKRINLLAKIGLEGIFQALQFQHPEENFVLVITGIDYAKSDQEIEQFKKDVVSQEMLPKLQEILQTNNLMKSVIYSSIELEKIFTIDQVNSILQQYQLKYGVVAQEVSENFIVGLLKKFIDLISRNCVSLNCLILTSEGEKKMSQLKIGDKIKVLDQNLSKEDEIVAMIHLSYSIKTKFLKIIFDDDDFITMTKDHLIYVSPEFKFCQAKLLKTGDQIMRFKDEKQYQSRIKLIEVIEEFGFISPLSSSGVMTINNCMVSCYSQCSQKVGDISTWPLRKFKIFRHIFRQNNDEEIHSYFKILMAMNRYLKIA